LLQQRSCGHVQEAVSALPKPFRRKLKRFLWTKKNWTDSGSGLGRFELMPEAADEGPLKFLGTEEGF
jgi:hypothetical protein